ncbi:uncharacterized protein BJ212DRAFT_1548715 [Suillus subaureus]|uniref:Protein kinase domain-containing protein n=1 Tax=Suillus subaureus TaxID=48587 RepID=A0A9P7DVM8_9AGAM|nr:uncharacterized protein BJ212DRAFT_1548715 [Suillus subaureus]KAG1804033.1 hypothetical protein BJ212DRAFT_1548715 [Suillus subaureus]
MNHCIPVLDVLHIPGEECDIMVMPLLRHYSDPWFKTFGEAVECFRQLFKGLYFMHKNCVAHRYVCLSLLVFSAQLARSDCMNLNIMMHTRLLFIDLFHPFRPQELVI